MNYADFRFLTFDLNPNGTMLVTLNRADAMNATNGRMHRELTKVLDVVNDAPEVRVIVVTGGRPRFFGGSRSVMDQRHRRRCRQGGRYDEGSRRYRLQHAGM